MLLSLSVRDFVLIEDAEVGLAPGLTVLSGETGAGKTLLTQALGLLLGERAAEGLVRETAEEALIQGVFELDEEQVAAVPPAAAELLALTPGELVATRRLSRTGRNRCFLNGVTVPLATMGDVLGGLVSFAGQHEHRRLLSAAHQRAVVDAYAGVDQTADLGAYGSAWERTRRLRTLLREGRDGREAREKEVALLRFEVEELERAALDPAEEEALAAEQRLLARAEEVLRACGEAAALLRAEDDRAPDVGGLLAPARARLAGLHGIDETIDGLAATLEEVAALVDDVSRGLRSYAAGLEMDPARLGAVEERLRVYVDLARKYGGTTGAAVSHLTEARARLEALEEEGTDLETLALRVDQGVAECLELAARLSERRREAARRLEDAVTAELADLGMEGGRVLVRVDARAGFEGLDAHGADTVEFLLAANPGAAPRSLARTASGGELSRVLLAVKSALRGCEPAETVVFDEIDAGVGGLTANAVGVKLRRLASDSQLVVVTHLPQVAVHADRHYSIRKERRDESTVTCLVELDEEAAVDELCRMLGGGPAAREHARALRDRAAAGLID